MTNKNSTYKRLGDYIREINVRNKDLSVTKLMGINIDKYFMPSVANVIGTDMSNYKVVANGQFACNLMHVGRDEKIPIALNTEDPIIVSPAYFVFEVCDNTLLPEYLELSLRNPEFDRNAWFHTDGDVRGGMDKEGMKDLLIPVPPLEEQRSIVTRYKAIETRIANNKQTIAKLEEAAQALYRKMFVDDVDVENLPDGWRMGTISDFGEVITGKTPSSNNPEDFGKEVQFVTPGDFKGNRFVCTTERYLSKEGVNKLKNKIIRKNDIVVTCIGSDMGKVVIATEDCISNQQINAIRIKQPEYRDYLYVTIFGMKDQLLDLGSGSSTLPMLNKSDFEVTPIIVPPNNMLVSYANKAEQLSSYILFAQQENEKLTEMLSLMA